MRDITEKNKLMEGRLNEIYMKYCCKPCPNKKCSARISLQPGGGCSQVQCTLCYTWFCWVCMGSAKGQKHFKETPDHWSDEGHLQPIEVTLELMERYIGVTEDPMVNTKFCCLCPTCGGINRKKDRRNMLTCEHCQATFCYICNKAIPDRSHYDGAATCHEESDPYSDL